MKTGDGEGGREEVAANVDDGSYEKETMGLENGCVDK